MRTEQDDNREVLNLTEAAAFIRVSQKTLRKMAREKRLPCRKVGREWRFLRRGLEQWLAGSAVEPAVAEPPEAYKQATLPWMEPPTDNEVRRGFGDTTFTKNRREPLHRWVPWIAGFSAAFVEEVFDVAVNCEPHEVTILDPFAGVGTTLIEGFKHGYNVAGFEINPYAALACEAKLHCIRFRLKQLTDAINKLEDLRRSRWVEKAEPTSAPPENFRSKVPFFSRDIERQVLLLQDFIAEETGGFVARLLKVALGSVMVGFSNYSYEPSLGTRAAAGKDEIEHADVFRIFCDKLWEMEADIAFLQRHMKRFTHQPTAAVHQQSYFARSEVIPDHTVDVLVTSPPYLNNYHYVRNTRPQLYWLGLVGDNRALKKLEEDNFGKFWQTVRSGPQIDLAFDLPELAGVLQTIRERNPGKRTYSGTGWANYAAAYFNDCYRFFDVTRPLMKPGGCVVVVIGNNIVQGVHIETDRFFAEIGDLHGFRVTGMHCVRRKRTGSSIVNSSVRAGHSKKRVELHETAVELRAPG